MKLLIFTCVICLLAAGLTACANPAPPDPSHDRWHGDAYRGGGNGGGGGGM